MLFLQRFLVFLLVLLSLQGCAPALIAGGAAAGYFVGKDDRSAKEIVSDASISTAVKASLIKDNSIKALDFNIDTYQGVVTLYGNVTSRHREDKVIALAKRVRGVKKIISKINLIQYQ